MSTSLAQWFILPEPSSSFAAEHPELSAQVLSLLYHRERYSTEQIEEFLSPDYNQHVHDPFLFRDMRKAVDRILLAIEKNEPITIHGDYDADGVCASVILTDTLTALGATLVDVYLPHRETDGYGLNAKSVEYLSQK